MAILLARHQSSLLHARQYKNDQEKTHNTRPSEISTASGWLDDKKIK